MSAPGDINLPTDGVAAAAAPSPDAPLARRVHTAGAISRTGNAAGAEALSW